MADSATPITDLPQSRLVLTRRNLLLCLTVAATVATWYAGPGLSYLPIAAFIVGLPIPLALSRLLAARPLKQVRTASNLLVLSASLFIAAQLLMIYRPAANPVPIALPLAEEWLVGQGDTLN